MKLSNVIYKVWCEPWAIIPAMHRTISQIVIDHVSGSAHATGGRAMAFGDDCEPEEIVEFGEDGIARIEVVGVVARRVSSIERSSGVTDIREVEAAIDECASRQDVRGVLITFSTPGGAVSGVPDVAVKIAELAKAKPVVAYVEDLCASAGYWLASQAGAIYAARTSETGSIGVYQSFLDESRAYEIEGNKVELFTTGKFKGAGIAGRSLTDEQRADIQAGVDKIFGWFKSAVNAKRAVPESAMDGRVFFADDALALDLIDAIGTEQDARAELLAMIGG